MGFRLTITLKTERTVLLLAGRPMAEWCEACGAESPFIDEEREAPSLLRCAAALDQAHRKTLNGRSHLCLRSIANEP